MKYETLWSNKEKTWEFRDSFIDKKSDGDEDEICEALELFECLQ
jgi:hypothetical protein